MSPYPWNPACKSRSHRHRNQRSGRKTLCIITLSELVDVCVCGCWLLSVLNSGRSLRACSVYRPRMVLWCPTISRYRKLGSSCAVSPPLTPPTFRGTDRTLAATWHGAGGSGTGGWRPGTDVFTVQPHTLSRLGLTPLCQYLYSSTLYVPFSISGMYWFFIDD